MNEEIIMQHDDAADEEAEDLYDEYEREEDPTTLLHKLVIVNNFSLIIEYNELYFEKRLKAFLDEFMNDYIRREYEDWMEYWQQDGELYVLNAWQQYQQIQLTNETCNTVELNSSDTIEKKDFDGRQDKDLIVERYMNNSDELYTDLWQRYREQIYEEQYTIFSNLYYQHYTYVRKTFLSSISENIEGNNLNYKTFEIPEDCCNLYEEEDAIERQKLELGLPMEFSNGRRQRSRFRKSNSRRNYTNSHETNQLIAVEMDDELNEDEMNEVIECTRQEQEEDNESETENNNDNDEAPEKRIGVKKLPRKKRKNMHLIRRKVPAYILDDKNLLKFWRRRYSLFSRFDRGIRLDREGWFSVTPEKIAKHLAVRLSCDVLVEACCGCGGNAIHFARTCKFVIAIDNNQERLEMAKHNAQIYGVEDKMEFILGDFFEIAGSGRLKADVVFMSPPWGGPVYKKHEDYDIEKYILPFGVTKWMSKARHISDNVALFLPRNANVRQVVKMAGHGQRCEIIHNYLDSHLVAITAFYGEKIIKPSQLNGVVDDKEK